MFVFHFGAQEIYNLDEEYTNLADLNDVLADEGDMTKKVNIFGVILGAAPPRQAISGTWMVSLTLIDDSCSEAESSVVLNVFHDDVRKIPICAKAGDVIRCHRVKVQSYKESIQLLGVKESSFNVARRTTNSPLSEIAAEKGALDINHWEVNSTALVSTVFTVAHGSKFRTMWVWAQKRLRTMPTVVNDLKFSIDGISEDVVGPTATDHNEICGDITCMVTAVIPVPPDQVSTITMQ